MQPQFCEDELDQISLACPTSSTGKTHLPVAELLLVAAQLPPRMCLEAVGEVVGTRADRYRQGWATLSGEADTRRASLFADFPTLQEGGTVF